MERFRLPPGPKRRPAVRAGAIAGLCVVAAALGWWARPMPVPAPGHAELRLGLLDAYLGQVGAPYVFLAGDSFVELYQPEPLPCGREVVNGGIGGLKVADYLRFGRKLHFATRPAVVLLSIGINDLFAKHGPGRPGALDRFRASAEALIGDLQAGGAALLVAAIPPVSDGMARAFDTTAFEPYSEALRSACGRPGCSFVDPYGAFRAGPFWRALPGSSRDGLHLTDLRAAFGTLREAFCR